MKPESIESRRLRAIALVILIALLCIVVFLAIQRGYIGDGGDAGFFTTLIFVILGLYVFFGLPYFLLDWLVNVQIDRRVEQFSEARTGQDQAHHSVTIPANDPRLNDDEWRKITRYNRWIQPMPKVVWWWVIATILFVLAAWLIEFTIDRNVYIHVVGAAFSFIYFYILLPITLIGAGGLRWRLRRNRKPRAQT